VVDVLVDGGRAEEDGRLHFLDGLEKGRLVVEQVDVVDETERTCDAHGVVDVDGLGGYARVGKKAEDDLLAGGGQPVEARGADEAEKLKWSNMSIKCKYLRMGLQ
jgi:hypothetical protein